MSDQQLAAGGQVGEQWENELAEQPPLMAWQATTYNAGGKRRTTGGQPENKISNMLPSNELRQPTKKALETSRERQTVGG